MNLPLYIISYQKIIIYILPLDVPPLKIIYICYHDGERMRDSLIWYAKYAGCPIIIGSILKDSLILVGPNIMGQPNIKIRGEFKGIGQVYIIWGRSGWDVFPWGLSYVRWCVFHVSQCKFIISTHQLQISSSYSLRR